MSGGVCPGECRCAVSFRFWPHCSLILGVTRVCKPKEDISSAVFKFSLLLPFNAGIKSLRATLPAQNVLPGILIFKGLGARRLYKSFDVKRINFKSVITCDENSSHEQR
jgi:hypothetical protein